MITLKRTPIYDAHQKLGARFVDFGGWEMPVQYSSIVEEHMAVRQAAGVFDISHMGEVIVSGPGAGEFLDHVLTNHIKDLAAGQAQYTLMCHDQGGVIDDLYVYRLETQKYLLIVNASRIDADWEWLQAQYDQSQVANGIQLENASDDYGAVAVQGPEVANFIDLVVEGGSIGGKLVGRTTELTKNEVGIFVFNGTTVFVARTGYTGEDGFEIIAPAEIMESIWNKVVSVGRNHGLLPAGLGARDTLRTEACYPLYGHELNEDITPLEAGLGFFVALAKEDFPGKETLIRQKAEGLTRKCVAFKMAEKSAPPRPHYPIWSIGPESARIGEVSSGTQSPSLGVGIGLGYVPTTMAKPGTSIEIEIRGKRASAVIVPKPFLGKKPKV